MIAPLRTGANQSAVTGGLLACPPSLAEVGSNPVDGMMQPSFRAYGRASNLNRDSGDDPQTGVPQLTSYWSMKHQLLTPAVIVTVLVTGGLPAAAQSTNTNNAAPVEVTPYVSLGSYPSPRVGAAVSFRLTPTLSVESEVGYHRDVAGRLSAAASLLYDLPRIGLFMPYLAAGAGLEEYATALRLPDGTLAAQQRTALAINAGGGLKVPVDDNWGIRTDARWFNGLGRDAGEHWRLYNGVTFPTGRR